MGWWSIVKSSRGEAYSAFLEEYGPEANLRSLELDDTYDHPEYKHTVEYYLSGDNMSDEIMGYWSLRFNGKDLIFVSEKYPEYEEFVLGMFQQEYPERYQEILDIFTEADGNQGEPLPIIGEYYKLLEEVMKSLRERIRHIYAPSSDYNREALPMMLRVTSLFYISPDYNFITQKLNNEYERSKIIYYITINMVDRMIRDVPMLRDQNNASRSFTITDGESTELRESLIQAYYGLFSESIGLNRSGDPVRAVNLAVSNRIETVIRLLNKQVAAYLGEES